MNYALNFCFSLKPLLFILLVLIISISCNDNNDNEMEIEEMEMESNDCVFEQIDDNEDGWIDSTEQAIMNECFENRFMTGQQIEDNLIGEWDLVGHGEGWLPKFSQPCANITFTSNSLIFDYEDEFTDTITTHQWVIKESNNGAYFLEVEPSSYLLTFGTFCEDYFFFNSTPFDGNMYLYQKI